MKRSHSISVILFIHGAIVSIGVKCGQLSCHSCDALLTNQTDPTPRCNRTVINCDDQKYFCGIVAIDLNTSALGYKEMCVDHHLCFNTTAACPQPGCYIHCCRGDLCNKYDKVNETISITYHLTGIIKKYTKTEAVPTETRVTKRPKVTNKINIKQTTHSTASLLTSSDIVLLLLSFVILKDCI